MTTQKADQASHTKETLRDTYPRQMDASESPTMTEALVRRSWPSMAMTTRLATPTERARIITWRHQEHARHLTRIHHITLCILL